MDLHPPRRRRSVQRMPRISMARWSGRRRRSAWRQASSTAAPPSAPEGSSVSLVVTCSPARLARLHAPGGVRSASSTCRRNCPPRRRSPYTWPYQEARGGPPGAPAPSRRTGPPMTDHLSGTETRRGGRPASSNPMVPVAALASSSRFARRCTIGTRRFRTGTRCAARSAAARPSLEAAFIELTADSVEYRAGAEGAQGQPAGPGQPPPQLAAHGRPSNNGGS